MSSDNCNSSFECSENVVKVCYESALNRDDSNFCDCSNWHGFRGENCDIPGSTIYYLRIVSIIFFIWTAFLFITSGKTFIVYISYRWKNEKLSEANPVVFLA